MRRRRGEDQGAVVLSSGGFMDDGSYAAWMDGAPPPPPGARASGVESSAAAPVPGSSSSSATDRVVWETAVDLRFGMRMPEALPARKRGRLVGDEQEEPREEDHDKKKKGDEQDPGKTGGSSVLVPVPDGVVGSSSSSSSSARRPQTGVVARGEDPAEHTAAAKKKTPRGLDGGGVCDHAFAIPRLGRSSSAHSLGEIHNTALSQVLISLARAVANTGINLSIARGGQLAEYVEPHPWAYEQEMMVTAGRRRSRWIDRLTGKERELIIDSPACCYEFQCLGRNPAPVLGISVLPNPDGRQPIWRGKPFMQIMSQNELEAHLKAGTQPAQRRECILCARFRLSLCMTIVSTSDPGDLLRSVCIQGWSNRSGPGEYRPECLYHPNGQNGLVQPFAMLNVNYLALRCIDPEMDTWVVDQTAMQQPPLSSSKFASLVGWTGGTARHHPSRGLILGAAPSANGGGRPRANRGLAGLIGNPVPSTAAESSSSSILDPF